MVMLERRHKVSKGSLQAFAATNHGGRAGSVRQRGWGPWFRSNRKNLRRGRGDSMMDIQMVCTISFVRPETMRFRFYPEGVPPSFLLFLCFMLPGGRFLLWSQGHHSYVH